jgi:hypothetical protein
MSGPLVVLGLLIAHTDERFACSPPLLLEGIRRAP